MNTDFNSHLRRVLEDAACATPQNIEDLIRRPLPLPCSPWEIYCLVAFLRHERRQKWVGCIVESRLRANGSELGRYGAFGHPDSIPQKGDVPGEAGWTYFFHGRGCCFSHTDGTLIDVDFADDGSALEIDAYFYGNFLKTAPELDWGEGLNHTAFAALKSWPTDDSTELMHDAFLHLTGRSDGGLLARLLRKKATTPDRGSPWCSLVVYLGRELLMRHISSGLPQPLQVALVAAFRENYGAMDAEAAFMLFLLDESAGRRKLADCLTDPIPSPRQGAAVFLAMIGDEACISILAQACAGPADCGGHEAACALSLLDHPKARAAAEMWLRRMDGYEDAEGQETTVFGKTVLTWSMDEMRRSNLREHVLYDFEHRQEEHGKLLRLRNCLKAQSEKGTCE
ncbi:MAG: DUF6896 domain-containing protein [Verrucomicrobiales bacterium]